MKRDKAAAKQRQKDQLDAAIRMTGLSLTPLAVAAGIAPSTLTRFYNNPDHENLLSQTTLVKIEALVQRLKESGSAEPSAGARVLTELSNLSNKQPEISQLTIEPPRDYPRPAPLLPVLGGAVGGSDGEFAMNGTVHEYVEAPPSLMRVPGAFAVYMWGESMSPKYEEGQTLFVHPTKPVRRGDYVVVELSDGRAFVKRFVSQDSVSVKLGQLNPCQDITLDRAEVKSLGRVVASKERE